MKSTFRFTLALAALLAIALPASAQEVVVLQNVSGNVMVSGDNGAFTSAVDGQAVAEGQSITVGAGGSATVGGTTLTAGTYGVGAGGVITNAAGVVVAGGSSVGVGVGGALGGALGTAGAIVGATALVGAGLESSTIEEDNEVPVQPISH